MNVATIDRWGRGRWLLAAIVLLAFALRVHDIAGQSLWSGEALQLLRAAQPLTMLLSGRPISLGQAGGWSGPIFPLLLAALQALLGPVNELGRLAALWLGVLSVPLIYRLGREMLSARVGIAGSLLLALSPLHVWFSQEIGPATALLLFSLLAALALWRVIGRRRSRRASWTMLAVAGAGLALIALTASSPGAFVAHSAITPGRLAERATGLLTVGIAPGLIYQWWRFMPMLILGMAGVVAHWRQSRRQIAFLLAYLLVPLIAWYTLNRSQPGVDELGLVLVSLPPLLILAAGGWLHPWRHWRGRALGLGLLMVVFQLSWLQTQFYAPELRKDDIRALVRDLQELADGDDLIILTDPGLAAAFGRYYQGSARWSLAGEDWGADVQPQLPAGQLLWLVENEQNAGPASTTSALWPLVQQQRSAGLWNSWTVSAHMPNPVLERLPEDVSPANIDWGGELTLAGFSVPGEGQSGAWWQPEFYWQKSAAAAGQYTLYLRLVDAQGRSWTNDGELLWESYPPGFWPADTLHAERPLWRLPTGLPPGEYQAWLQVARTEDGQLLPASSGGTELLLTPSLSLEPATAPEDLPYLPAHKRLDIAFGSGLTLLGYSVATDQVYRPGHVLPVTLFWQANGPPPPGHRVRVQLSDSAGALLREVDEPLFTGDASSPSWPDGALLTTVNELPIPAEAAGNLRIMASILPADGEQSVKAGGILGSESVPISDVFVEPWPLETTLPPIDSPLRADFGDPPVIELHGYNLSPVESGPGEPLSLTLYWRANALIDENYVVFVHLVDGQGNVAAQGDGAPVSGFRPTSSWRPGEVFTDSHMLALPEELSGGPYSLWIGLYDPISGVRLPIMLDGAPQADGRLLLRELDLSP